MAILTASENQLLKALSFNDGFSGNLFLNIDAVTLHSVPVGCAERENFNFNYHIKI